MAKMKNSCKKVADQLTTFDMRDIEVMTRGTPTQNSLYEEVSANFGPALGRLARSYEADPDNRLDLLQEIHLALWRSFEGFDARCSLRTWVYRVAHNVGASHVISQRWTHARNLVSLESLEEVPDARDVEKEADRAKALERLFGVIQRLNPPDRQVILLYLEGMDAASIGEITGLSPGNTATKIHRIKKILADRFWQGGQHDQ